MNKEIYEKLRNERDELVRLGRVNKHGGLSKVAESRLREIRNKLKDAHRTRHIEGN